MHILRLILIVSVAWVAGCQDREPAAPALLSVTPSAARVLAPLTLQLSGQNLNARSKVDFERGVAEPAGDYAVWLESASGGKVDLSGLTRTSATAATAVLTPPLQPGTYAMVLLDPWGRTSRLERAFRALDVCERADGSGPHPGDSCDGDDTDLCLDDVWQCIGDTLVCSHGADNVEICDGADNDCDPLTLDGSAEATFGDACDGADLDLCAEGTIVCNGTALVCGDATGDSLDVCDGLDNDCNPATADGSGEPTLGTACDGIDSDLCAEGTVVCNGAAGLACTDATGDSLDVCDGIDNDCNPLTPDGSAEPTLGAACDGPDSDLCKEGAYVCNGALGMACDDASGDVLDVCDGIDDDCNPATLDGSDEPTLGTACDGTDADKCTDGLVVCNGAAGLACTDDATSIPDLCDGLDNDCNPSTADGSAEPTLGTACDGTDADKCADGLVVCNGSAGLSCTDDATSIPDVCDGIDNDCNSATADGADDPELNKPCDGNDNDLCEEGVKVCSGGALSCTDNTTNGCAPHVDFGTFRKTTGPAGTLQDVAHTLNDVPKALILWTDGSNVTGYLESYRFGMGFTDALRASGTASASSANAQYGGASARRLAPSALAILSPGQTVLAEAVVSGWDARKFTLNWTTNNAALADVQIHYLALSGELVRSHLVNWQTRTSDGLQSVSGMGFQPQLVLSTHGGSGYQSPVGTMSSLATSGFGAMDGTRQWATTFISDDGVAPTQTARGSRTTRGVLMLYSDGTLAKQAAYASMDPGGFSVTVNYYNGTVGAGSQVYSLGVAGLSVRADCFQQLTSSSSQQISGVGFRPLALLFSSIQLDSPLLSSNVTYSLGGADADAQAALGLTDTAGVFTSQVETVTRPGAIYVEPRLPPGVGSDGALAQVSSFDADGFTLAWPITDTTVTQICYVAFGP